MIAPVPPRRRLPRRRSMATLVAAVLACLVPAARAAVPPAASAATCDWPMYGHDPGRTFSTPCPPPPPPP
ncbi:MAG TPA: hypothetical protein VGI06_12795, partial [Acidimicrobiales bacterium]